MEQGFLENNKIKELSDFLTNTDLKVCLVEGKTGFFKTPLINTTIKNFDKDFLVFKIKCFEYTTLDDIFLSIFEDLKKYSQQKRVSFTKIETNSFAQRINQYLHYITTPAIIIIDSLQNVFDKKNIKEKEEILRFISHINSMNKFKLILVSSSFPADLMNDVSKERKTQKIELEPFTKEQTAKCFLSEKIELQQEILDNFYKISNGNPTYTYLTLNILTTLKTSVQNIIDEFEKKNVSFEEYLIQKLITFIPENVKKSINELALFNGGLPEDYLIKENFFTKEQIAYITEKGLLTEEYGYIYVKSFIKKHIKRNITNYEKIRIHKLWRDFFISQLPAKPNERVILISRNTMRAQIEYHSSFIVEQPQKEAESQNMSLMSYLNSNLTAWNIKNTNAKDDEEENDEDTPKSSSKRRPKPPKSLENRLSKRAGFEKYELTKDEIALLSVPIDMRKKQESLAKEKVYRTIEQKEDEKKKEEKSIQEIFELAQNLEEVHNFETATTVYLKALAQKYSPDYETFHSQILERLAFCCRKMNKTTEAIDFYNNLIELYATKNENEKINEIKLEIARIYKETYKINHARVIYENFIKQKNQASDKIVFCSYVELAEIEEDLENTEKALEYYKKAFNLSYEIEKDEKLKNILSIADFKYALILDDMGQTQSALDFYQKCTQNATQPSVYLSSAFTNIGEILKEGGNNAKAIEYYKQALKTDLAQSNYEGVYYICKKIATTYEQIDNTQVLNWLLKSLSAAKRTGEKLYISQAYKEIGNYYSNIDDRVKSQKAYILADKNKTEQ